MNKSQDFTKILSDMSAAFPMDMSIFNDAMKNSAELSEKMSKVVLDAAATSADLSNKYAKETITKMGGISKVQSEPSDYAKAFGDFASAQVESTAEHMAAFAEVAKKAQMETVELLMAAGKEIQEDTTQAVKKAAEDIRTNTKKAVKA